MSVFVDPLATRERRNRLGNQWCHMIADDIGELHQLAKAIGVHRCWFHRDHYDLNPDQREAAIAHGAVPVSGRVLVAIRQTLRRRR
jgi:Ser/Thr protein kinase RdoA (MazF antagonist)